MSISVEPRLQAEARAVPPARLAHVVFKTPRFREMIEWYRTFLVAQVAYENEMISFLSYDEEHHRVAFLNIPPLGDRTSGTAGIDHIAFTYDSLSDLLGTHARLREAGILPFWGINHGPTTSLYYRDPDGNQVEAQIENFDTDEAGAAFFASREFAENPIGVDFDPDDLRRRLQAGVPEADLKKRPNIGPRGLEGVPLA